LLNEKPQLWAKSTCNILNKSKHHTNTKFISLPYLRRQPNHSRKPNIVFGLANLLSQSRDIKNTFWPGQKSHWLAKSEIKGFRSTCNSKIDWASKETKNSTYPKEESVRLYSKRALRWLRKCPLFKKNERIWVSSQRGREEGFRRRSCFKREWC